MSQSNETTISQHNLTQRTRKGISSSTAFPWNSYSDRSRALEHLRHDRIHVDTILETHDGERQYVHWQVMSALCARLADKLTIEATGVDGQQWAHSQPTARSNGEPNSKRKYTTTSAPVADVKQRKSSLRVIRVARDIDSSVLRTIVACAYTGTVELNNESFEKVFMLAQRYTMPDLIGSCLTFLLRQLNATNCVRLYLIGCKHKHALRSAARSLMVREFKRWVGCNREIGRLPCATMVSILRDDYLDVEGEEQLVWNGICCWFGVAPTEADVNIANEENSLSHQHQQQQHARLGDSSIFSPRTQASQFYHASSQGSSQASHSQPMKNHASSDHQCLITRQQDSVMFERNLIELLNCIRFECVIDAQVFEQILRHALLKQCEPARQLVISMRDRHITRCHVGSGHRSYTAATQQGAYRRLVTNHVLRAPLRWLSNRLAWFRRSSQRATNFALANSTSVPHANHSRHNKAAAAAAAAHEQGHEHEKNVHNEHDNSNHQDNSESYERRARVPSSVTFIFGGWSHGRASRSIWSYDSARDQWFKLATRMREARAHHASVALRTVMQEHIFVVGGTNGNNEYLSSCLSFNVHRALQCTERASMHQPRCFLALVAFNELLYAIGGHDGTTRLRSSERYHVLADQWHPIADMTIARSDASAAQCQQRIYVAGGQITDQFIQSSVEFYTPRDDSWTFVTPMQVPRMAFRLVALNEHALIAIGGTNGHGYTRTVERFTIRHSIWSLRAPLEHKRSSFGVVSSVSCRPSGASVAVIGGYNGRKLLRTSEAFDWRTIDWRSRNKISTSRSAFATCLVSNVSNARDYTFYGLKLRQSQSMC